VTLNILTSIDVMSKGLEKRIHWMTNNNNKLLYKEVYYLKFRLKYKLL
jgi:hypothetical protein